MLHARPDTLNPDMAAVNPAEGAPGQQPTVQKHHRQPKVAVLINSAGMAACTHVGTLKTWKVPAQRSAAGQPPHSHSPCMLQAVTRHWRRAYVALHKSSRCFESQGGNPWPAGSHTLTHSTPLETHCAFCRQAAAARTLQPQYPLLCSNRTRLPQPAHTAAQERSPSLLGSTRTGTRYAQKHCGGGGIMARTPLQWSGLLSGRIMTRALAKKMGHVRQDGVELLWPDACFDCQQGLS